MKQMLSIFLALCLLLSTMSVYADASTTPEQGCLYQSQVNLDAKPSTDKTQALNSELVSPGILKRELTAFISPSRAKVLMSSPKTVVVDVRPAQSFASVRIPGSLNMPAHALTTKSALKHKTLIVLDEGFAVSAMAMLYQQLQAQGFTDVNLLDGGLTAWRDANGHVDGDGQNALINKVSAQQYFIERQYDDVLVLALPASVTQSKAKRLAWLNQAMAHYVTTSTKRPTRMLIMTETGQDYPSIMPTITTLRWSPVFYLDGGIAAYQAFLQSQQAMLRSATQHLGKFPTCGRRKR